MTYPNHKLRLNNLHKRYTELTGLAGYVVCMPPGLKQNEAEGSIYIGQVDRGKYQGPFVRFRADDTHETGWFDNDGNWHGDGKDSARNKYEVKVTETLSKKILHVLDRNSIREKSDGLKNG